MKVVVEHGMPAVGGLFENGNPVIGTGAMNQRVNSPPLRLDVSDQAKCRITVRNIGLEREAVRAARLNRSDYSGGLSNARPVANRHVPAVFREVQRETAIDPPRSPGD